MSDAIFLTGATGFLGTEIAARLLEQTEKTIYALVRAEDEATGSWRDYADRLLTFACSKNFMKQTEHTVFQQAMGNPPILTIMALAMRVAEKVKGRGRKE